MQGKTYLFACFIQLLLPIDSPQGFVHDKMSVVTKCVTHIAMPVSHNTDQLSELY